MPLSLRLLINRDQSVCILPAPNREVKAAEVSLSRWKYGYVQRVYRPVLLEAQRAVQNRQPRCDVGAMSRAQPYLSHRPHLGHRTLSRVSTSPPSTILHQSILLPPHAILMHNVSKAEHTCCVPAYWANNSGCIGLGALNSILNRYGRR